MTTPVFGLPEVESEQSNAHIPVNTANRISEAVSGAVALDKDATSPPSANEGDMYIVGASASGAWAGEEDNLAVLVGGVWKFVTATTRFRVWVSDEARYYTWSGTTWEPQTPTAVESGITASTTQTQGQGPLSSEYNEVSTCATTNDTVTMPPASAGRVCRIRNNGAQTLQVFPASGDDLGSGVDTAITITAGNGASYIGRDATNWDPLP